MPTYSIPPEVIIRVHQDVQVSTEDDGTTDEWQHKKLRPIFAE
jgi:hypothetical protein